MDYQGIVPNNDDESELREICEECANRKVAIEVGSWVGASAILLSEYFDRVFCIDTWQGMPVPDDLSSKEMNHNAPGSFEVFCQNVGDKLFKSIIPLPGDSLLWAQLRRGDTDLIYIDGDHRYGRVRCDIMAWLR